MATDGELQAAHDELRLATAAYAEMIAGIGDPLETDAEFDEVLRRQVRAQQAWERYVEVRDR
jgi:hypothetical protein